jgi:hypothetical protein
MKHGTPTENIDRHITAIFAMEAAEAERIATLPERLRVGVVSIIHTDSEIITHICRQMRIDGYKVPDESLIRERIQINRK